MIAYTASQSEEIRKLRTSGLSWVAIARDIPGHHSDIRAHAVAALGMSAYLPGRSAPSSATPNAIRMATRLSRKLAKVPPFDLRPPLPPGDPASWGVISGGVPWPMMGDRL